MTTPASGSPRYELYFKEEQRHSIWGETIRVERLYVVLQIAPHVRWLEATVDTGAYLSIFPQRDWRKFAKQIQWPTPAEEAALPTWCRRFGGVGGGRIPCRFGKVSVQIVGLSRPLLHSASFSLTALFALDSGELDMPLFGLGGGSFVPHQFRLDDALGQAALIANAAAS